jgi:hypothetical protein
MSARPTRGEYWTLVDISSSGCTETYEHRLPHGTLVRVATRLQGTCAESVVFVPQSSITEPYR